jgi:excisionase family DNA binding protein
MEKLLSTSEVCKIMGLSSKTILKYVAQGKLTPIRINKRVFRFTDTEVKNFVKNNLLNQVTNQS